MAEFGVFPSSAVVNGNELPQRYLAYLVSEGIVAPDEKVQMFYSAGITSISGDGNLLTDKRVISYERINGKLSVYAAYIENISDVKIVQNGDFLNDTIIGVWTTDGGGFRLFLSVEDSGDTRFINEIKTRISHH